MVVAASIVVCVSLQRDSILLLARTLEHPNGMINWMTAVFTPILSRYLDHAMQSHEYFQETLRSPTFVFRWSCILQTCRSLFHANHTFATNFFQDLLIAWPKTMTRKKPCVGSAQADNLRTPYFIISLPIYMYRWKMIAVVPAASVLHWSALSWLQNFLSNLLSAKSSRVRVRLLRRFTVF